MAEAICAFAEKTVTESSMPRPPCSLSSLCGVLTVWPCSLTSLLPPACRLGRVCRQPGARLLTGSPVHQPRGLLHLPVLDSQGRQPLQTRPGLPRCAPSPPPALGGAPSPRAWAGAGPSSIQQGHTANSSQPFISRPNLEASPDSSTLNQVNFDPLFCFSSILQQFIAFY